MQNKFLTESLQNTEGSATWQNSNGQPYLEICASDPYDRGLLSGINLHRQIRSMKHTIEFMAVTYMPHLLSYKKFIDIVQQYKPYIPKDHLEEMQGIADAIKTISFDDVLLQNCFIELLYGQLIPKYKKNEGLEGFELGCTAIGAITNDEILLGQNFDLSRLIKPSLSFVHLKTPSKPDIFSLRLGALLNLPVGITSNGLRITVNVVKTTVMGNIAMPTGSRTRHLLEKAESAEHLYRLSYKEKHTTSFNLIFADQEKMISTENLPNQIIRSDIDTTVVRSNTFITEELQKFLLKKRYSKKRQEYTEMRVAKVYDPISMTPDALFSILADNLIVCRRNPFKSSTLAFYTQNTFGIGNPRKASHGFLPPLVLNNVI